MNKIVIRFGLLAFFLAVIYFTQREMSVSDVLLRSFVLFLVITVMVSIFVLAFMKAINKNEDTKRFKDIPDDLSRK
jgi:multisubunit Na+/H+ antiporter MnhC subunit